MKLRRYNYDEVFEKYRTLDNTGMSRKAIAVKLNITYSTLGQIISEGVQREIDQAKEFIREQRNKKWSEDNKTVQSLGSEALVPQTTDPVEGLARD